MSPIVRVEGDDVFIESVVLTDPVAARLLEEVEGREQIARLGDMLEVGARVLQHQQDGEAGAIVRRELEVLRQSMDDVLSRAYESAGAGFVEAMRPVLERVAEQIVSVSGKLDGVLAVQEKTQELEQERARGTAKGHLFEDEVAQEIEIIARHQGDTCEHTGSVGSLVGRVGDIVVGVDGASGTERGRIVFEIKTGKLSRPEAMRELDEAKRQRSADFAVLVVARGKTPSGLHNLREYGGDKMVVEYEDDWVQYEIELAYSLARARVLAKATAAEGVDVDAARAAIEQASHMLSNIRSIKLRLTGISTAASEITGMIDTMVAGAKDKLAAATAALRSSET